MSCVQQIAARALDRCAAGASAWTVHTISEHVTRIITEQGVTAEPEELRDLIALTTKLAAEDCLSILPLGAPAPEHVAHLTSLRVIGAETELRDLLTAGAETPLAETPLAETPDVGRLADARGLDADQQQAAAAVASAAPLVVKRERGIGAGDQANVRTTEVPFSVLKTIDAYIPSLDEQRVLADYLDRETAQIDGLIAEQRRLIGLLREREAAVIAQAVDIGTRVPLRRLIVGLRQGWSPNCEPWPADGVTERGVLRVGCSKSGTFDPYENKRLPDNEVPRPELAVRRGEIVMSRSNSKELVGAAAVLTGDYPRLLLSDLTYGLTVADAVVAEFLCLALRAPEARAQISAVSKGTSTSMQKISQRDIRELYVRLPERDEQRRLAHHIEGQVAKMSSLILEAERLIALSEERRASLITAAVTGKIDVRKVE